MLSKNIFIAAGAGSFEPRRPPNIDNPDKFINKGVEYAVRSVEKYENKDVFIFGGGDSALDWTVELSKIAKSISLVHRRDVFRGAQHTEKQMRKLVSEKKVKLLTPYLINSIEESLKSDPVEFNGSGPINFKKVRFEGILDNSKIIYLYSLNENGEPGFDIVNPISCLLYTSPSPRD